jgi:ankyrin repeat protein
MSVTSAIEKNTTIEVFDKSCESLKAECSDREIYMAGLISAAVAGNTVILQHIAENIKFDVNSTHDTGFTALYVAVAFSQYQSMKQLIALGADVRAPICEEERMASVTPLELAIRAIREEPLNTENNKIMKFLLVHESPIRIKKIPHELRDFFENHLSGKIIEELSLEIASVAPFLKRIEQAETPLPPVLTSIVKEYAIEEEQEAAAIIIARHQPKTQAKAQERHSALDTTLPKNLLSLIDDYAVPSEADWVDEVLQKSIEK